MLAAFDDGALESLLPRLERVPLRLGETIIGSGEVLTRVYFPTRGVISLLTVMESGDLIEAALVGSEGMFGLSAAVREMPAPWEASVELAGEAVTADGADLREHLVRHPATMRVLLSYGITLLNLAAQSSACNRFHPVEERAARWLLMLHDRANSDELHMTQGLISDMLGVHRPTVTLALGVLRRAGLIESRRGVVAIIDRPGLEAVACECYRRIQGDFNALGEWWRGAAEAEG